MRSVLDLFPMIDYDTLVRIQGQIIHYILNITPPSIRGGLISEHKMDMLPYCTWTWDMFRFGCCVRQIEGSGTSIVPLNTCRAGTIELTVPGTVALADVGGKKVVFSVEPCCTLLVRTS